MVVFGAKWCKSCPLLLQGIVESPDVKKYRASVQYLKIDADSYPDLCDEYAASSLPFCVFLHKNGTKLGSYMGSNIDEFVKQLDVFSATFQEDFDIGTLHLASEVPVEAPVQPVLPSIRMIPFSRNKVLPFFPKKDASCTLGGSGGSGRFNSLLSFEMLHDLGLGDVPFRPCDLLNLNTHVCDCFSAAAPDGGFTHDDILSLYTFEQPTLTPDGTCSNIAVMADSRFNLAIHAYGLPGVRFEEVKEKSADTKVSTGAGKNELSSTVAAATEAATHKQKNKVFLDDKAKLNFPDGRRFNAETLLTHPMTLRLYRMRQLVARIHEMTKADWIGIYRMHMASSPSTAAEAASGDSTTGTDASPSMAVAGVADVENAAHSVAKKAGNVDKKSSHSEYPALLKESYFGEPSRAVFPVTKEFAAASTNSWVAISGKVRMIRNTNQREDGVSYYKCSGKVQSELCLPILQQVTVMESDSVATTHYQVIGIIDLEAWKVDHFSSRTIAELLKIGLDLAHTEFGGLPMDATTTTVADEKHEKSKECLTPV